VKHRPSLVVINIVGLTPSLLGEHTPHLNRLVNEGFLATMEGVFPAVTCTAQSTMLTGLQPKEHGIVGNGWYFRDLAEIGFWRQSNRLVQGRKIWETARELLPEFSTANLFWWYNMYSGVDYSVTPRPIYPADGRKIPALYSDPGELEAMLVEALGEFPFFDFWGPKSGIPSSKWLAEAAKLTFGWHHPDLLLVYLPHLDYNLQRLGPDDPRIREDVRAIDEVAGSFIEHVRGEGADVLVVSEYGIEQATGHVNINQVLRTHGYLEVRETLGWELLDAGASRAFAVADHQVAHVYVKDPADLAPVSRLLRSTPGIARVLDDDGKRQVHLNHHRSGELVTMAEPGYWFTYYYWLEDAKAPDFAPTVDIHRKPGYDPVELFVDPDVKLPAAKVAWRVLQKTLGFRMLMAVIPLKPELVQGTHGRPHDSPDQGPLLIGNRRNLAADHISMTAVKDLMLRHWT